MVASLKDYMFWLFWCFLFYFYEYLTVKKKISVFLKQYLSFWSPWSHCYWAWESEATIHWGGNAKFAGNARCQCQRQVPLPSTFTFLDTNKNSVFSTSALIPSSEPHHCSQQNEGWQEQKVSLNHRGKAEWELRVSHCRYGYLCGHQLNHKPHSSHHTSSGFSLIIIISWDTRLIDEPLRKGTVSVLTLWGKMNASKVKSCHAELSICQVLLTPASSPSWLFSQPVLWRIAIFTRHRSKRWQYSSGVLIHVYWSSNMVEIYI